MSIPLKSEKRSLLQTEEVRKTSPSSTIKLFPKIANLLLFTIILVGLLFAILFQLGVFTNHPVPVPLPSDPVELFRAYLRINTAQPTPDYAASIHFLRAVADLFGLPHQVLLFVPEKPIFLVTIPGDNPTLPSILFLTHSDVVASGEGWTYPPFSGEMVNGTIYGRGAQDMKANTIQILEALRRLRANSMNEAGLKRTVYVGVVPDGELGGELGSGVWVKEKQFSEMKVGMGIVEGLASETDIYNVYYGEKTTWSLLLQATGPTYHSSLMTEDTAMAKIISFLTKIDNLRKSQFDLLNSGNYSIEDVISININMILGGIFSEDFLFYEVNSVPPEVTAAVNMRLPILLNVTSFRKEIFQWCSESQVNCSEISGDLRESQPSRKDPGFPWVKAINQSFTEMGMKFDFGIFPAGTEGRRLREREIPVYGFSPMIRTPLLYHEVNEQISETVFLNGISIYENLIQDLGNVPSFE